MRSWILRKSLLVISLGAVAACSSAADATGPTGSGASALAGPEERARAVALAGLRTIGAERGIDPAVLATAVLDNVQVYGGGAHIAQFSQRIDGIEVFRGGVALSLDRAHRPIALTGALVPTLHPQREAAFTLTAEVAIERAVIAMTGIKPSAITPLGRPGAYTEVAVELPSGHRKLVHSARAKRVWFQGKRLAASYYVELDIGALDDTDSSLRSFVVAAGDGAILFENDLVANDTYTYRVWAETSGTYAPWAGPHGSTLTPHPTGVVDSTVITPLPAQLVSLENAPFSKNDPWLLAGATETLGNNVTAYADLVAPDGFASGDVRPQTTAPLTFDFAYDSSKNPNADAVNSSAAATQLFYLANWLHDWFYDAGFNEAARNPQANNFGRGGLGNDRLRMEAQDYSGRNNANAATPADGASPRVQMFLFNGQGKSSLTITEPSALAGAVTTRAAAFGPANFDVTASVVLVDDGSGTATDGCEAPFVNAATVKGKIALIDRGTCPFTQKVQNATAAGAVGVLIGNNVTGGAPTLGGTAGDEVTTPTLAISLDDAGKMKAATGLAVRMLRETAPDRDGGLDTAIASHEWGHVLSNRLIGNGNGLINNQGGGMGEGWSDFVSLLTMVRTSDVAAAASQSWNGVYPVGAWIYGVGTGSGSYFGIRRYPYSADLTKNPLTFKHVQNGTALPDDVPVSFGESGSSNAEVHATGEVWSAMLWQCYVQLLRDPRLGYEEATTRMRSYLVGGMKLTPVSPTIMEARDALLTAMYAADQDDFKLCAKGFAERGAGIGATGPDRESRTNVGVKESFVVGNDFEVVSLALAEGTSCDGDGVLDNGESGTLTIKLRNVGTDTLPEVTAKLSSKSGKLVFANGARLTFPSFKPFEAVEAKIEVTMNGADAASTQEIEVALDAPGLAVPRTVQAKLPVVVDFDNAPESSAIDTVESADTSWKVSGDNSLNRTVKWQRVTEGVNQRWSILGNPNISDQRLVSPPLVVAADKPFTVSFSTRYAFERDERRKQHWDGGVVEISTDGGASWKDIGESVYTGTLQLAESDNPLKGRKAFVYRNPGYPAFETMKIDLGTAYAGQTVQIRFRMATDEGTASGGWDVDDIAFEGIANTPFTARVADVAACGAAPESDAGPVEPAAAPSVESGGCGCRTQSSSSGLGASAFALVALAIATRRRSSR